MGNDPDMKRSAHNLLGAVLFPAFLLASAPARADTEAPPSGAWGDFGIQTRFVDSAVRPGDDFNAYVNGKWLAQTAIPADRSDYGTFVDLDELSKNRLHAILGELAAKPHERGSPEAKIAAAYKAFMDTDAIDKAGLDPARPYLKRIFSARTTQDLVDLFAAPGFASPIGGWIDTDPKASDTNRLNLEQSGLGLPDRDYYLLDEPRFIEARTKYAEFVTFLLGKAGHADPQGGAVAVLALETRLAAAMWDRALKRDRVLTYNRLSLDEVRALPHGDLLARFIARAGGSRADKVLIDEIPPDSEKLAESKVTPEMAAKLGGGMPETLAIIASEPLATWQAWLAAHFLADHASVLPGEIDRANFAFYGTYLNGQPRQRPRWKRAIGAVEGQVGEQLGKIYAARFFPPASKAAMDALVGNLRRAMAANLADLDWMGPQTRLQAQAKLDAFTTKIGYPDRFKDYRGLKLSPVRPLENAIAAGDWDWRREVAKLGKPVDRSEWGMLPQTVNAYYNANFNEIVFPAAILQPPFFDPQADAAVNYGAIGAVIGHEIGHGFDDQGARMDGQGMLRDWWTAEDKARFEALQARLGAQFARYCPFDEGRTCIDPDLTMGENIGDLGGLSLAWRAWQLSLDGKPAPVIGGFTGEQRFFMGWAQIWRQVIREESARQLLLTDPHSPADQRINGIVRNFDEWYRAFDVKPGDRLYLPPEQRVRIW